MPRKFRAIRYTPLQCSLFVAVIVDNLARAQAAANYSRNRDNSTEHVQVRQRSPLTLITPPLP